MIRFFFQAFVVYFFVKLLLMLHVLTYSDLKEFGLFCFALSLLFIFSRYSIVLRDKLYPNKG